MKVVIDAQKLHDYRILSANTMSRFSQAQLALIKKAKQSDDPVLHALVGQFADVLRDIDWADKFMSVHGAPLKKPEKHRRLREQLLYQVCHR